MAESDQELRLTVMTLNLRFGRADDGPDSWEKRKERYVSFFQDHRPDFFGMQEANGFQIDFLRRQLAEYDCIGQRIPSPPYWQDNIIFYKKDWCCSGSERFFFSHTPMIPSRFQDSKWPRQCILGHFQKSGRSLMFLNTHFDFLSSVQERSAKMIVEKLSEYDDPGSSVLITGDFNALPDSPGYREFTTRGNFKEVFSGEYSGTYHNFTGTHTGRHIDWILYRGPMELVSRKMIVDPYPGGYPSDHFPVLAEFRMAAEKRGRVNSFH
jgi:endonuclease/exonuclease/phosphatase family metal-dependent hydrolase